MSYNTTTVQMADELLRSKRLCLILTSFLPSGHLFQDSENPSRKTGDEAIAIDAQSAHKGETKTMGVSPWKFICE